MARLKIPSISLDLPVYHGTADDTLLKGLGHLEGTSLPVGGEGTRSVITGHRGLAEATMFTNLDKVKTGDSLIVEVSERSSPTGSPAPRSSSPRRPRLCALRRARTCSPW